MHSYTLVLILPLIDTKLRFLFLFLGVTMGYPCMEVFPWVSCETCQLSSQDLWLIVWWDTCVLTLAIVWWDTCVLTLAIVWWNTCVLTLAIK